MANNGIISKFLYTLYASKSRLLRRLIEKAISGLEGGLIRSQTIRRIYKDYHQIEIGMYSYGGCFNKRNIRPYTKIGRYCSFAEGVCIFNANHPLTFKSTHPFFYDPSFGYVNNELITRRAIEIGNDVWIGQNALIMPSVKYIGDGAVIGSGAVVTKDVPSFAIVVGNPAEVIRYRFSEETRKKIVESQWWRKDIEDLQINIIEFLRPLEVCESQAPGNT
jgi:acetyltransferase-like isoleucine patch superfamily enzyme